MNNHGYEPDLGEADDIGPSFKSSSEEISAQNILSKYLAEAGSHEVLAPEDEANIFRRIELGRRMMLEGLCNTPETLQNILDWYERASNGEVSSIIEMTAARSPNGNSGKNARAVSREEKAKIQASCTRIAEACRDFAQRQTGYYATGQQGTQESHHNYDNQREALAGMILAVRPQDELLEKLAGTSQEEHVRWSLDEFIQTQNKMMEANLRLVISIARTYFHTKTPFLELIQEGNLGLKDAVHKFDYRRGYKFSVYATQRITARIRKAFHQEWSIRVPAHVYRDASALRRAKIEILRETGREAKQEELVAKTNRTSDRLKRAESLDTLQPVSLEAPIGHDEDLHRANTLATPEPSADECVCSNERQQLAWELLALLPAREEFTVRRLWGIGNSAQSYADLNSYLNLKGSITSKDIEQKALRKLRHIVSESPKARELRGIVKAHL